MTGLSAFTERLAARRGPTSHAAPAPSPDGTRLAWIADADGRPRAWLAELSPGKVAEPDQPLSDLADVTALAWSPDGAWIALQVAPHGGERTGVHLVDPATGEVRDLAPGAAAATLGSWSPTGRQVGLTVFPEGSGDGQACLVDVRDGTSTVLAAGPAARVCAVSGDGRRAVVRLGRRGARHLELVDLRTGRRTELIPGGEALIADARFGVTGRQLYVHTDAGRERAALLAVTLRGTSGVSTVFPIAERADHDLDMVALDPAGARAALVWNVDGRSETELLDLRSGHVEPLAAPEGEVVTGLAFTRAGDGLLLGTEGPTVPPRVSHLALDHPAAPTPLLPAEPEEDADLDEDAAPTLHAFRAEDGLALQGWLFRPRGALGPLPTLLWLHGGPEAQERPVYQPLFQALLASGVAVFAPNVRGSGGYGRTFAAADDLARRFVAITDVRAAVSFLVEAELADPERVGVAGRSYGGYLTLAALARFPELFAVGVDVCGISDFATFYAATEPWIAAAATTKYGDPAADAELLRALSPIHQVDKIAAPLLVVHGAYDTNVPLVEAEQVVAALRERGASPGFLLFDDEGHEVHGVDNRAVFVREVVAWVSSHLSDPVEQTA